MSKKHQIFCQQIGKRNVPHLPHLPRLRFLFLMKRYDGPPKKRRDI